MNPLLVATGLQKSFRGKSVVNGIDLTLHAGEIVGILGPNGAGKTTTAGMLHGIVEPDSGSVTIDGYDIQTQGRKARQSLGVVTQDNNLDPDFDVRENLIFFAHHYRITGAAARHRADELLTLLALDDHRHHKVTELSGGLQRRLVLARALIHKPSVVFLDEPTTGLDPEARQLFWRLIGELRRQNTAILLTTHYMDEAERLCDRLLLMRDGREIDHGTPKALIERFVGREVIEVDGVDEETVRLIAQELSLWTLRLGESFVIESPGGDAARGEIAWARLSELNPSRLTRRRGDLQDVFLKLTGVQLG